MLPQMKTASIAAITSLSLALGSAAPAHALGKNERNFLKGVAAAVIVGVILNDANRRAVAEPAPQPRYEPRPEPRYEPRYEPRDPPRRDTGRVVGSSGSVHNTVAAQTFNSYSSAQRRAIQSRLRAFGYYNGGIDGAFGPGTYRAVLAYARDSGGAAQLETRAAAYGVYDGLIY